MTALDEARLAGDRDELVRHDKAAARVLPAHERLDPDDATARDGHLRLVVQDELVPRRSPGAARRSSARRAAARASTEAS